MTNGQIADQFSLLSKLMDILGEDAFRAKNYSIAAYHIDKLPKQASEMDESELFAMKGIGKSTGSKIIELLNTGKLEALEEIVSKTPVGVLDMMQIKGLGPKKIAIIWKEMGIESVGELEYACNENRLASFKGFGAKTQQSILQNIEFIRSNQNFRLWAEVEEISKMLVTQLGRANPDKQFALTGEIRRQLPTIEFIDIATDADARTLTQQFSVTEGVTTEQKENILEVNAPNQPLIRIHLSTKEDFYTTLFKTSASEEFLSAFTKKYEVPEQVDSEEKIFEHNKLQFIPPALREQPIIIDTAASNQLPELIKTEDINSIIHSHSTWSDGADTIENMAKACINEGYEYMVISDHSQAAFYANGLTPERIAAQHQEIEAINEKLAPFKIFKSIEVDILNDGSLDYSDDVLATLDIVIASVHTNLKMTEDKAMDRVLKAIHHPYTNILGHPTGRLLLSREGYPLDHKVIIEECVKHDVVIEINAHPRRLDLDWTWISYAMEAGALLSIDPDAHAITGYHDVYYGVLAAQKGGLTKERNLSSYTLKQFEEFVAACHKKRNQ